MMNIGIVAPFNPSDVKEFFPGVDVPYINNGATSVGTLVKALLHEGQMVTVFTISHDILRVEEIRGNNIVVYLIPTILSSHIGWFRHHLLLDSFYLHKRLSEVIGQELSKMDVLHAHWTYDYALACMPYVEKIPVFVSVRDWAPTQYSMQTSLIEKVVWTLKLRKFRKVMGNNKVQYIANSEYILERILSAFPSSRTVIIPNPLNKDFFLAGKKNEEVQHKIVSIAQSLDDPGKNIGILLVAFKEYKAKYPQAELHLVGSFDENWDCYKDWEGRCLLDGVVFHGRLPLTSVIALLDEMSSMVHPSITESFGNVLLEAIARSVPCVGGNNSGAVPYVLGEGRYGLLCDISDPHSIFCTMDKLNDANLRNTLITSARKMLENNFLSDVIARKHISLYAESIKRFSES